MGGLGGRIALAMASVVAVSSIAVLLVLAVSGKGGSAKEMLFPAEDFGKGYLKFSFGDFLGAEISGGTEGNLFSEKTSFFVSRNESLRMIEAKSALVDSIFVERPAPYPGAVTAKVSCQKEFLPEKFYSQSGTGVSYVLPAGARFNYGVCANDLVIYDSTYILSYCERSGIFREIKVFAKARALRDTAQWERVFNELC